MSRNVSSLAGVRSAGQAGVLLLSISSVSCSSRLVLVAEHRSRPADRSRRFTGNLIPG